MDRFWLHIICASLLLLVTAFALGTPGLRAEGSPQQGLLLRVSAPFAARLGPMMRRMVPM
jgi:hypothetical protein